MTFPVGPILSAIAQQREYHTTPRTVYGVPANSGVEQAGPAGSHEHEYDHVNGTWVCWICDHVVTTRPPVEATELAE